jgi:hypothetical protein
MTSITIASIIFGCVFAGGLAGLFLHPFLPKGHLTKETQDVVRLGTGMLSVLSSLVLGLLVATAKSSFDTADHELRAYAADLIQAGQVLDSYGPETARVRDLLRRYTARVIEDNWGGEGGFYKTLDDSEASALLHQAHAALLALDPKDASQRWLKDRALQIAAELVRIRSQLIEGQGSTISSVVLAFLVFWITVIFASFGFVAPQNASVVAVFLVCSLSIAGAIYLVLEMNRPLDGLIAIPSEPMRSALAHLTAR